jgi:LuxR family maltose regulon positive regulatory protein
VVAAPAGSGKTTLLAEWAASTALPIARLSLEAADNDPRRFLTYVIAALERLDGRIGRTALSLLRTSRARGLEHELVSLVNDLANILQEEAVLLFDD